MLSQFSFSSSNTNERYTTPENKAWNISFSEAVRAGNTIYLSGRLGIRPGETQVVSGGIVPESEQVLKNIESVLKHF